MSFFGIAYIAFITIAGTLFFVHFRVWLNRRRDLDNLMFSLAALGAAFLGVLELLYFQTADLEDFILVMKLMHIPIFVLLVSITWFVWFYFGTGRLWMAQTITALWILGLVLNFLVGDNLTFLQTEGLREAETFSGEVFYIPFGKVNQLTLLVNLASLLFVVYVIDATLRLLRKGQKHRAYLVGFSLVFFILLAGTMAPLNDYGILETPSMISLPFIAILLAMSIQLTRDVMQMSLLSEEVINKEARWAKLLKEIKLLVVGVDVNGMVSFVNPHFLEITGYTREEVCGKDWIRNFIPEHSQSKLQKSFPIPLNGNVPMHFENSILTKSGIELMIFWSNVRILDDEGKVKEIIAIGTDITDREEAFSRVLELKQKLEVENLALKETFDAVDYSSSIVIKSDSSKYTFQMAKEVSQVDTTVLLQGETGVGKGVYAQFIHKNSKREGQVFLQVNCAAIPTDLLESELFGYERGAFTGAIKQKKGRFELADGGTLFLDEIGELPGTLQAKLLRVLQSGEFERLGSEITQKANVRIIAATNRILSEEVQKGNFREDLYYRINVFPITIPPLRKRKEDIPDLMEYFTIQFKKKYEKKISGISKQSYVVASKYNWPGNIRELQNVIERAVITSPGDTLRIGVWEGSNMDMKNQPVPAGTDPVKLDDVERSHILKILDQVDWRIHGSNGAAELLDINPSTLRSRIKKLGIQKKR